MNKRNILGSSCVKLEIIIQRLYFVLIFIKIILFARADGRTDSFMLQHINFLSFKSALIDTIH